MKQNTGPLMLLVKPVSGSCDLRCRYCFYADEAQKRDRVSYGRMSAETLELLVREALSQAVGGCTFAFQGGEPTLAGLDFYKKLLELEKRYNRRHIPVQHAVQTNGCSLDRDWAAFFARNRFLVGLSLDGTREVHDAYRRDAAGEGSFQRVQRAAQLLQQAGVDFNVLTVVTNQTVRSIGKIYGYFKRNGLRYQQYIPCLDPLGEERGQTEYALTPEGYGEFLCRLFDLWYADLSHGDYVYIRYFENLAAMLLGRPAESCGMSGQCACSFTVEADGSVYPCDFYVLDPYLLGHIGEQSFAEMAAGEAARAFVEPSRLVDEKCRSCRWGALCRGGCRRDREPAVGGVLQRNYFCPAFERFFDYAAPRLRQAAVWLSSGLPRGGHA